MSLGFASQKELVVRTEFRRLSAVALVLAFALAAPLFAQAPQQPQEKRPLFDTSAFRPQVVLYPVPMVTQNQFVTVSGVVFSRSQVEKVTVGERTATLRPAEPKDLVKLDRVPDGASDAPFRTYFEVPDAGLSRTGANDLEVRAYGADQRVSDAHRLTVVRSATPATTPAPAAAATASGEKASAASTKR